jgi:hypothetical protein
MNEMVAGQDIVPMDLVQRAVTSGADVVVLEKLMGLQERYEHNKARKAFDAAISAFKLDAPQIVKDQLVDFTTNRGRTRYKHADLAAIAAAIDKPLAKVGLSYRWRTLSRIATATARRTRYPQDLKPRATKTTFRHSAAPAPIWSATPSWPRSASPPRRTTTAKPPATTGNRAATPMRHAGRS